jgi:PDZ domain-containing secreted protein
MSFADAQGRGVLVERIDIRSFTLPLLQPGDLVIGIDDRRVTTSEPLERYIRSVAPGSLVVLTIERDNTLHYVMLDVPGPPE